MADYPDRPPEDLRERAARIRDKQERGETLTREETGVLGALGASRRDIRERKKAEDAGRRDEWEERNRVGSWMNAPGRSRAPEITRENRERAERLREKENNGETLTNEESGFLGAMQRLEDANE